MAQTKPEDYTTKNPEVEVDNEREKDATVRDERDEVKPVYDTHSFDTVDLSADDVDVIIRDALYPMGDGETVNDDVVREFSSKLINDFGEDHAYISENNIQMLALLQENGHLSEDELRAYVEGSNAERLNIMKTSITNWLDDPNAGGKDTLVANMCVESMLGADLTGNNAVRALEIQSSDILFGSTKDGHINTFFYNGLKGDTLYAANNILENMYAKGDITEDQYFEACESWESKMMSMAACGNNIIEMMAARDALRTDYENEHSQTPEEAMREFCEKQGWDYEEFINGMQNPETWDGTNNTKKDAYRFPLVNGEWPEGTDDKYKDAYEIMMLDNAMGETEEEAQVMEDTLREALHAGISAFKDILTRSEVGQKILMICNNFVHSEPINGTLFQEIWDLEDVNANTYEMTTPPSTYTVPPTSTFTPTPTSGPGPEESEAEESEEEESEEE